MRHHKILFGFIILLSVSSWAISDEQKNLNEARQHFEKQNWSKAIAEYNKIPETSDRYFLALEEKAWAYIHLDQLDKAIAITRTLTSPALVSLVGTEPYLLQAIAYLKLCDYVSVFQTLKEFKTHKRTQVEAVQQIAKKKKNGISDAALSVWMENPNDWKKIAPYLSQMPLLFYRDTKMQSAAKSNNKSLLMDRLQQLAIEENNENFRILQKLNLIEVESIQRVHIATEFSGKQGENIEKDKYDLVFKDTNEVWLDELDSYQATVNRCKKKSGRTM